MAHITTELPHKLSKLMPSKLRLSIRILALRYGRLGVHKLLEPILSHWVLLDQPLPRLLRLKIVPPLLKLLKIHLA